MSWQRLRRTAFITLYTFALLSGVLSPSVSAEPIIDTPQILISTVRTDGKNTTTDPINEYVELYNPNSADVDVSSWVLEYIQVADNWVQDSCKTADWSVFATVKSVEISNLIIPSSARVKIAFGGMSDDKSGVIRLSQISDIAGVKTRLVHDVVGWGSLTSQALCFETQQTNIPKDKFMLSRCLDDSGMFVDTDDNSQDFKEIAIDTQDIDIPKCHTESPIEPTALCDGLVVDEVLPNPAGSDSGNEFVELYNPTDATLNLEGCRLYVEGSSKTYIFPNDTFIQPNEYQAFYDKETGLVLPNASGGTIILASETTEYPVEYEANLKDDESWATIEGVWQSTDNPTPGFPNESRSPVVETPVLAESIYKPCDVGEYRSPETNRCRNIVTSSSALKQCDPGQERNPSTNRCRSIVATLASLLPCNSGQERNPDTNRCRKVLSANTTNLKPCDEGEERSPDTNRCRKKVAAKAVFSQPQDNEDTKNNLNYAIMGAVGVSAVGYGAYEYRTDVKNRLSKLKGKKPTGSTGPK